MLCFENYLIALPAKRFRDVVVRLRLGVSELACHRHRYNNNELSRICPVCHLENEDTVHFLFHCTLYDQIRADIIPIELCQGNADTNFTKIFNEPELTLLLARFVTEAMKLRETFLQNA